jgi:type IX secretion system PorP/SprF family membrane protein
MKLRLLQIWVFCTLYCFTAKGQSIHFSQYYNAPMLLNAANTALMPDYDMRIGANYRNQWSVVPVPFNTYSGFADFKVGASNTEERKNWLGIGLVFFGDKAGDGNLSLSQIQGSLAYHLHLSDHTLLSLGGSGAYVQRTVNYDNLSFDLQWDGHNFDEHIPNGEKFGIITTNYYTVNGGLNFAWFPNEFVYCKLGGSVLNINNPNESFYDKTNVVGYRPMVNLDMMFRTGENVILNPSAYYSTQRGAWELVAGTQARMRLAGKNSTPMTLILGLFDRIGDAIIGVAGVEVGPVQFMSSYDMTTSGLSPYNASYGALEFSIIYQRPYQSNYGIKSMYSCPRF